LRGKPCDPKCADLLLAPAKLAGPQDATAKRLLSS